MNLYWLVWIFLVAFLTARNSKVKFTALSLWGILGLLYLAILFLPSSFKEKIPFIREEVEDKTKVTYSADKTVYIGRSSMFEDDIYYLTIDDINVSKLNKWIDDTTVYSLYFAVASEGDILYTRTLPKNVCVEDIVELLNDWRETNELPSTYCKYWIFCFYVSKTLRSL